MYVKMKELGPIGGGVCPARPHPLDPPMTTLTRLEAQLIVVCVYCYVITLGLSDKYDMDGHYFRFAVQILAKPWDYVLYLSWIENDQNSSLFDKIILFE